MYMVGSEDITLRRQLIYLGVHTVSGGSVLHVECVYFMLK